MAEAFSNMVVRIFEQLGFSDGLFALFFIGAHVWLVWERNGRIEDLRRENERLSAENLEHRERFERLFVIMPAEAQEE